MAGGIKALAPGKVVLWGEYAVLVGAPALVMAVNRYAICRLGNTALEPDTRRSPVDHAGWKISSAGYTGEDLSLTRDALLGRTPPPRESAAWMPWQVLKGLDPGAFPEHGELTIDTDGFYQKGIKLGLGSSAAVCVALYGAFTELFDLEPDWTAALAIHHQLQGGKGSGIDVAAAWFGGLHRFERHPEHEPQVANYSLPPGLGIRFVWAGQPAQTTHHLARFDAWRANAASGPLDELIAASSTLFEVGPSIEQLANYVRALKRLDRAAKLTIYDEAHLALDRLATTAGVVYKPCGAGGGDIGAAFSYDPAALDSFIYTASDRGFAPVALETAAHGIEVRR